MFVHSSNRLECLADALANVVAATPLDPLLPETIVVEGRGIERWLGRRLADRLGVWANAQFPFPRSFLRRAFAVVLDGEGDGLADPFDPDTLAWSVAAALLRLRATPAFAPIAGYLDEQPGAGALLALSRRIARTLDQYVVYRPDWIAAWENGRDDHWQAILWREVVAGRSERHIASRAAAFMKKIDAADLDPLPPRVCLFGLSTLAPLYLECFAALARRREVHLFLQSPSSLYWGDIRSDREVLRDRRRRGEPVEDLATEVLAVAGNPLLASLGGAGRDFQANLVDRVDFEDREAWDAPRPGTMLHTLQHDIFHLVDRRVPEAGRVQRDPADDSIQFHACHGPLREVQVLHDRLRDLFEQDGTLQPHDVVVLCPEIDTYAPLVEAVFGAGGDDAAAPAAIPFRVADRRVRERDELVDAFLRYLAALDSRLTATDVVDLVDTAAIRERFAIADADVVQITAWVRDAAVRWAIDAEHRALHGQPPLAEHTWRFGLERLFLGFAMESGEGAPVAGRVPTGIIEASAATALGAFAAFCERLFERHRDARRARSVAAWCRDLGTLVDEVLTDDRARHDQRQAIRDALGQIAAAANEAAFDLDVDLAAMRTLLEEELERGAPGRNFLTGSVTFCALVPMRSVPFRVVCLLGMNDETFPRRERRAGFDLMATNRRLGDRSPRADDRYLFLEALLAARDRLIVSWVGRDQRDNEERPPSTVVSELRDAIDTTFSNDSGTPVSQALTVVHPLQPFSPRYFDTDAATRDPQLWSYSETNLAGARALTGTRGDGAPFALVRGPLPEAPERVPPLTIDRLARFLENPARAFLRNRLGLVVAGDDSPLEDREPLALDGLATWRIGSAILARGSSDEAAFRAAGELPPGTLGSRAFADVATDAAAILAAAAPLHGGTALEPVYVDTEIAGERVTGVLDGLWPEGLLRVQFARASGGHLLGHWVRHLFLCLLRPAGCGSVSTLVARAGNEADFFRLRRVDEPAPILEELVALYRRGHTVPIPLFPRASRAWHEAAAAGRDDALQKARKAYADGYRGARTDADDPAIAAVFGRDAATVVNTEPLFGAGPDLSFTAVAAAVFGPLCAHLDNGSGDAEGGGDA